MFILLSGQPAFKPPVTSKAMDEHLSALHQGPDFQAKPFPLVTRQGRDLLDWMLLPDARGRCTASEALRHSWFRGGKDTLQRNETAPVLWSSSCSELRFLRVMGVWCGSSVSGASMSQDKGLSSIEEAEGEAAEGYFEEMCCRLVRHMEVPVCISDPSKDDCPVVAVSRGFELLTGYMESNIIGKNCRFLNSPRSSDISAELRARLQRAARGESTFLGVLPNATADGRHFENLLNLAPLEVQGKTFIIGIQMEVEGSNLDLVDHPIVGTTRKVHTTIRHWMRSTAGQISVARSLSAP